MISFCLTCIMRNNAISQEKHLLGVYYTPDKLADYLLSQCPNEQFYTVFDPSCGGCSLLDAAKRRYENSRLQCFGCDKKFLNRRDSGIVLKEINFFDYSDKYGFDLIVTNPPFVRYDKCDDSGMNWLRGCGIQGFNVDKRSDIWVYFIIKGMFHLKDGGCLAAILPWSFVQANYSAGMRKYLRLNFGKIRCQMISVQCFSDTAQKVVLLWLEDKGSRKGAVVQFSMSNNITNSTSVQFDKVSANAWDEGSFWYDYCFKYKSDSVHSLSQFCDVKIGVVTGANDFFIRTKDAWKREGVTCRDTKSIITSGKELQAWLLDSKRAGIKRIVQINAKNEGRLRAIIKKGELAGYDTRVHCKNRKIWYSLNLPEQVPDAFFSYRASSVPLMSINSLGVHCTNSVLAMYFHENVTLLQQLWIQMSLLSAFSLHDIETKGRVYGKNVLKIEPSALKSVRVFVPEREISRSIYTAIELDIRHSKINQAIARATKYIFTEMGLSDSEADTIKLSYEKLRNFRMGIGNDQCN